MPGSPGQSHLFHSIRLESYEDSLNNLRFRELGRAQARSTPCPTTSCATCSTSTRGSPSLLDTERFDKPFQYQLNITRQQETAPQTVDLVTTFNFLLGLRVHTIRTFQRPGYSLVVRVLGDDGDGRRVCVLWRDAPPLAEMEAEKQWLQANVLADVAYDLLYINGGRPFLMRCRSNRSSSG